MSIQVADGFSLLSTKPLDGRLQFSSVANMKAFAENSLYNGCFAYITENKKYYTYDSSNTVDSTTGKWREFETGGGASALSDLTDTNISTPTDGQVLQYDDTNDEWVNGDAPKGVVQGYAYEKTVGNIGSVLDKLSEATNITINKNYSSVPSEIQNPVALVALHNETDGQLNISLFSCAISLSNSENYFKFKLKNSSDSGYGEFCRRIISDDGVLPITNNAVDVNNCDGYYGSVSSSYTYFPQNKAWGWEQKTVSVYVYGDIDLTLLDNQHNTVTEIPSTKEFNFYSDSQHTQLITPTTDELYYDISTDSTYVWNGSAYVMTSGAGASSVEDLTDTEIDTETLADGQILQYNGTDEKWENADLPEVDTTKLYSTEDTAETALDDADYVPFYDSSATAKRKSLWSNIKSVLKTYFDTLYNGKPTVLSQTLSAGSTSVTFSNVPTTGNYLIYIYTSKIGLDYDLVTSIGSMVTVSYASQSSDITVYMKIEEV